MLSRTHLSMGIATSLFLTHPTTLQGCFVGIIGGAIGGVVCDIDAVKKDYQNDALAGQGLAFGISIFVFSLDYFLNTGICSFVILNYSLVTLSGVVGFLMLYVLGYYSDHRTFTHSLLYLGLMTLFIALIHFEIAKTFAIGFVTHLFLDLLNKSGLRLLYPSSKKMCLNLCYAAKTANKIFLVLGIVASNFFFFNGLFIHLF